MPWIGFHSVTHRLRYVIIVRALLSMSLRLHYITLHYITLHHFCLRCVIQNCSKHSNIQTFGVIPDRWLLLGHESTPKFNLTRLQLVQNVGCRILLRKERYVNIGDICVMILHDHGLLQLDQRKNSRRTMECFKHVYSTTGLGKLFKKSNHRHTRFK